MENLFTQTFLRKALSINQVSNELEPQNAMETTGYTANKSGAVPEMIMVSTTDNAVIGGKEVDLFGSMNEDRVAAKTTSKKFSDLGFDLISKMKKLIWDLINSKTPADPKDPTAPDNPKDPTVPKDPANPDNPKDPTDPKDPTNPDNPKNPTDPTDPDNPKDPTDPTDPTDPDNPKEPDEPLQSTKTLTRGEQAWTSTFDSNVQVLTLANPFGAKNYQYKISSTTGDAVTATFEFLTNGRLVVTGDNLKIEALNGQKDDLIILGNFNVINTGDYDDIVRVGYVQDSNYEAHLIYNDPKIDGADKWTLTDANLEFYTAVGNQINTGDGNDYVSMFGNNYKIDMGTGNDKVQSYTETIERGNIENSEYSKLNTDKLKLDGKDGWTNQGTEGDCRLLAIINSFCGNSNDGDISKYVQISQNGSRYIVTFPNYKVEGKSNTVEVYVNEILNYTGVFGDLDTIIADYALNKLIDKNRDFGDTNIENAHYNTIARYLTGSDSVTYVLSEDMNEAILLDFWNLYNNGEINNLGIGINNSDYKQGVCGGHAYSLKYLDPVEKYVELINPWDDADVLRLSISDLLSYGTDMIVYGEDILGQGWLVPNGGTIEYLSGTETPNVKMPVTSYYGNNQKETSNPFAVPYNIVSSNDTEIEEEISKIDASIANAKKVIMQQKQQSLHLFS